MSWDRLVALVALIGWLVLVTGALRSEKLRAAQMLRLGFAWVAIFLDVFLAFAAFGGGS